AVDGAVVNFQVEGEAPGGQAVDVVQALDHIGFPGWAIEVQLPAVETGQEDAELAPVAGLGQGQVADVKLQVEVFILDPVGAVQVEGNLDQLAAKHRRFVDTLFEAVQDVLEADDAVGGGAGVVDQNRADMKGRRGRFVIDEYRVHLGELFHLGTNLVLVV